MIKMPKVYVLQFSDDEFCDCEGAFSTMEKAKKELLELKEGLDGLEWENFRCEIDNKDLCAYYFEIEGERVEALISEFTIDKKFFS